MPDEVDIKDPPTIVNKINNKDKSSLGAYVVIPDVEIEEIIESKIFTIPSPGLIKK